MQDTVRRSVLVRMPVLPLRGMMIFPHMVLHFDVGRPKSVAALEKAMMEDQRVFLVAQIYAAWARLRKSSRCSICPATASACW